MDTIGWTVGDISGNCEHLWNFDKNWQNFCEKGKKKKCLLVSSDTTHPSGSIPPINLAQVNEQITAKSAGKEEHFKARDAAEAARADAELVVGAHARPGDLRQIYRQNRPRRVGGVRWNKQAFFSGACVWRSISKRPMMLYFRRKKCQIQLLSNFANFQSYPQTPDKCD